MVAYSPFDKDLKDLEAESLSILRQVSEGWYIEYKREVPNATSIAKSISAFANTYGGWLFFGVVERSKEDTVAGEFPGIAGVQIDASLQRIRQAAASHVNPAPHFDCKVLWGPRAELDLPEDHAVICIHVPWSPAAPHVHKSGQIYRRVADGSEPRPEGDRFVLDQLFRRGDDLLKQYRDWVDRDPELSKGEEERPYLRLMLVADLWHDRDAWADVTVEDLRAIMGQGSGLVCAVPFDTVYTTSTGFVGRQLAGNNPFNLGLTWQFRPTLVSDILIPLNLIVPHRMELLAAELDGYLHIQRFAELLAAQQHEVPRVVDLNFVFNTIVGVVEIQRRLMKKAGWTHSYFAKARLINAWRTVPFLDVSYLIDGFEQHGTPMCLDGETTTPDGTDPESFVEIAPFDNVDNESSRVLIQSLALFAPIARAYGLPPWIKHDPDSSMPTYYDDLRSAGDRATEVQRLRNERMSSNVQRRYTR